MSGEAGGVTQVAGGALSAVGNIYSSQSQANMLNTQATLNTENAQLATEQGAYDSMKVGVMASQKIGAMSASYGASGVEATSGSVLDTIAASTANKYMDVQNVLHGAAVKAVNYQNDASIESMSANNATTAGYLNAFASVLGAGGKAFGATAGNDDDDESDDESDDKEQDDDMPHVGGTS